MEQTTFSNYIDTKVKFSEEDWIKLCELAGIKMDKDTIPQWYQTHNTKLSNYLYGMDVLNFNPFAYFRVISINPLFKSITFESEWPNRVITVLKMILAGEEMNGFIANSLEVVEEYKVVLQPIGSIII